MQPPTLLESLENTYQVILQRLEAVEKDSPLYFSLQFDKELVERQLEQIKQQPL